MQHWEETTTFSHLCCRETFESFKNTIVTELNYGETCIKRAPY